jgi:hypothetical protein
MSVKLVLLKSGEQVISDLKELVAEDKIYGFLFENPLVVTTNAGSIYLAEEGLQTPDKLDVRLESWITLSADKKMVVPKDWIVTYVNPVKDLLEMYEECTNGNDADQVSFTEE